MNDSFAGAAGPAVAAHSKDASVEGPTAASSATGKPAPRGDSATVHGVAGSARAAASEMAGVAAETLSRETGRAADHAAAFVRAQPLVALLGSAMLGFVLGSLLARR
jgi:ElaB/YqjD/DUF883 family membrane-anchored ribosome-binding protein